MKRPWLRRTLARRLDPQTATGLALTLALGLAIVGGLLVGVLAFLMRSSATLVSVDNSARRMGQDHATPWSTHAIQLVTDLGGTWLVIAFGVVVCVVEYVRACRTGGFPSSSSRWSSARSCSSNSIKDLLHGAADVQPDRRDTRPFVPERSFRDRGGVLAAVALVLARRRSPRARSLLAGAAVAVAIGVAASRVLLGVHWLSDVVAGLAFGWGWFAVCAIAFGGRFLSFGEPAEKATRVAERAEARRRRPGSARHASLRTPALHRPQDAAPTAGDSGEHDEPMGQGLAGLEAVELLLRDRPPQLVDELRGVAGDLVRRRLQMLGPEAEPGLAGERRDRGRRCSSPCR